MKITKVLKAASITGSLFSVYSVLSMAADTIDLLIIMLAFTLVMHIILERRSETKKAAAEGANALAIGAG